MSACILGAAYADRRQQSSGAVKTPENRCRGNRNAMDDYRTKERSVKGVQDGLRPPQHGPCPTLTADTSARTLVLVDDCIQVFMTVPAEQDGRRLAQALVEEKLAACFQILGPMQSTFYWQGKVETAAEYLCLIKTTSDAFDRLKDRVKALHPYDVPELIAVPITAGSEEYVAWLKSSVSRPES
jgi:periplasmic divalent cation tolerance protein